MEMKQLTRKIRKLLLSKLTPEEMMIEFPDELGHMDNPQGRAELAQAIGIVLGRPQAIFYFNKRDGLCEIHSNAPDLEFNLVVPIEHLPIYPKNMENYGVWSGEESVFSTIGDTEYARFWEHLEAFEKRGWSRLRPDSGQWHLKISERRFAFREKGIEKMMEISLEDYHNPDGMKKELSDLEYHSYGNPYKDGLAFLLAQARFETEYVKYRAC